MNEYRLDVISGAGRERTMLAQESFEASGDARAYMKAPLIVARHVTTFADAGRVFGDLWRPTADGSLQAEYVGDVVPDLPEVIG